MSKKAFEKIADGLTDAIAIEKKGRTTPPSIRFARRPISMR
jgi:hypothetical protein